MRVGRSAHMMYRILSLFLLLALLAPGISQAGDLVGDLSRAAPMAKPDAIRRAVEAMQCATGGSATQPRRLALIDYSLPSSQRRLWVFDLKTRQVLYKVLVAHGRNSGSNYASHFSNSNGSFQSSLGLFRTLATYRGKHGYSLRLEGMEPGLNDNAQERAIVIHGAKYVNPDLIALQGRIGRSLGCPAVRPAVAKPLIDALKNGQYLYAYYPGADRDASLLTCNGGHSGLLTTASNP